MILFLTPARLLQVSTSMNKGDSVSNVGGREGQDDYYSSGAVSDMHFFFKKKQLYLLKWFIESRLSFVSQFLQSS